MDYRPKKALDIWLNDKGFYRKHVAMDETCLFRAISDQLYNTQIYHELIRSQCIEFANKNRELFTDVLKDSKLNEHLDKLHKHFVVCGDIEMQFVSKMVERDFIIIDAAKFSTANGTNNGYEKFITLCKMKDDHYDSVCLKEYVDNSGFCQSLVYKLLYEKVFEFENLDNIVQTMLYPAYVEPPLKANTLFDVFFSAAQSDTSDESKDDISKNPPFPYKVAKALDPNQYRNIQFDAWNQTRKELRIKDWYLGGEDFKVGTKCLLVADNNTFECYIQDLKYKGQADICLVHVVEWASKEIVKREELMPIPNAKPWPLPYAIARNKNVELASSSTEIDEVAEPRVLTSNQRRRRNKRLGANNIHNNNNSPVLGDNNNRTAVNCLEGCPLVASSPTQYVEENSNMPVICKEQPTFDENENYSVPFEFCMLPLEPTYSVPFENNGETFEEDQPYTGEAFASDADWNNYQALLPAESAQGAEIPVSYPAPYVMPSTCVVTLNPPMYMATQQYNTVIREETSDNQVTTVYTKYVEKTYCSNNNSPVNYQEANYNECEPQMPPSPLIPDYEYKITPFYPTFEPQFAVHANYPMVEPQMMPEPNYPEYMPLVPMMPVPPESPMIPVTPVSPMPFYPQPLPPVVPLPAICPCQCYMFVNAGPIMQPNGVAVPRPNLPMLMPNEPGKINQYVPYESNSPNEVVPYTQGCFPPPAVPEQALMPPQAMIQNNVQSF